MGTCNEAVNLYALPLFKRACDEAKIPATKRQASKWLNGYGSLRLATGGLSIEEYVKRCVRAREKAALAAAGSPS